MRLSVCYILLLNTGYLLVAEWPWVKTWSVEEKDVKKKESIKQLGANDCFFTISLNQGFSNRRFVAAIGLFCAKSITHLFTKALKKKILLPLKHVGYQLIIKDDRLHLTALSIGTFAAPFFLHLKHFQTQEQKWNVLQVTLPKMGWLNSFSSFTHFSSLFSHGDSSRNTLLVLG